MRERDLEAYFVKRVKEEGWLQRKFVSPGVRGVPDRILAAKGSLFLVEFKALGKSLRPSQRREHSKWHAQGIATFTISSVEGVDRFFKIYVGAKV